MIASPTLPAHQRWAIFCQVIDNFGDIGVCWRLAAELGNQGVDVRLHIDDASALHWMAPQGAPGVTVLPYNTPYQAHPDVVVEAFGCEAPAHYLSALSAHHMQCRSTGMAPPVLVNLEYLSAESYVERCHRLASLIMAGEGAGLTRWFFYPGFTHRTGGLLRERALAQRQLQFDRAHWRTQHGIGEHDCAVALFCYEPPALAQWLEQLQPPSALGQPMLCVTPGRATAAVQALPAPPNLAIQWLSPCSQLAFDELLWACDLNLVRGEDSLVRALWAGQAFVWQIYPQEDCAHHAKLEAFLDWLQAPCSLRAFHYAWNGMAPPETLPTITPELLQEWQACAQRARSNLLSQNDLITQLQQFVAEKS